MHKDLFDYDMQAAMIRTAIKRLEPLYNQRQLSRKIGFKHSNMLSMIRNGEAPVPIARIPAIARVLEIDPAALLRTCVRESWPAFDSVVYQIFGGILTEDEREWVKIFSEADLPVPPIDPTQRKKIIEILKAWSFDKLAS